MSTESTPYEAPQVEQIGSDDQPSVTAAGTQTDSTTTVP